MKNKVKSILRDLIWVGGAVSTSTHSIGGGEWSIEVSVDDSYCCEFVGSNGTQDEEADDLHSIVNAAIQEAERLFDYIAQKWPDKLRLIRLHSQLIEAGGPEIDVSDRISVLADPANICHIVIVDGKITSFKSFLGNAPKEELKHVVKSCVKRGVFPSQSLAPRRYRLTRPNRG